MGSTPKRKKLRAVLLQRARLEAGPEATEIDYVVQWVAGGGLLTEIAASLETEMGESVSRSFLSMIVHRLTDDSPDRIKEARRLGATALVEDAIGIADRAPGDSRG